MKRLSILAALALSASLAACASQPEPYTPEPQPDPGPVVEQNPEPQGPIPGSVEDFEVNAGDRVFFALDQHTLSNEARTTLRRQAAWLASYPGARILIAGNCDERGTREYNLALGARRANAARDFLVSQGVDPSRISTVSYGKERPVCNQSSEQCWATNRNAMTVIQSGAVS
ncbi:peptidoglycan-associated lipoprotein Pal [Oceanicaulis sp. LC35]|uniref:peptidoglycan-associated lipoprotein Pal n=1 Tax=Oceanicaulis sp. LC35 TaxID=3349635 RepID=UPI003F82CDFD